MRRHIWMVSGDGLAKQIHQGCEARLQMGIHEPFHPMIGILAFVDHQPEQLGMRRREAHVSANSLARALPWIRISECSDPFAHARFQPIEDPADGHAPQLVLGLEVIGDETLVRIRALRDVPRTRAQETLLGEGLEGGSHDPISGFLALLGSFRHEPNLIHLTSENQDLILAPFTIHLTSEIEIEEIWRDPMKTARIPEPLAREVRPSRFSHMVVKTRQFPEMVAFYKTVLSAQPMFETDQVCFLTYDEEHHRIMIGNAPNAEPRDPAAVGVVHWAYAFDDFEQLANAYRRLRSEGILPKSCINHGFTTSLYYADPDGNEVELAVDNFDDPKSMNDWFATGAFDRNFVGVPFDPEEFVEQQSKGTAIGALMAGRYE